MTKKTKIVLISIACAIAYTALIVFLSVFLTERHIMKKHATDSFDALEKELDETKVKMNEIQSRNDELIKENENQKLICEELQSTNIQMNSDIIRIKEITESTETKLMNVDSSTENMNSIISQLKANQTILREYYESVSDVINLKGEKQ